jgi:hypothetical protein
MTTLKNISQYHCGPGQLSQYRDFLQAGGSGDRVLMRARFSATFQTGPGGNTSFCIMGTGSIAAGVWG